MERRNLQGELPGLGEGLHNKHKALGSTSSSKKRKKYLNLNWLFMPYQ